MSTGEINEASDKVSGEPAKITSTSAPGVPAEAALEPVEDRAPNSNFTRRRFLTAAALGTAAATLLNKGSGGYLHLGPATALADDLSGFQCTANDVRIVGPGRVINEPCNCSNSFAAQVQFTVENNAASDRFCITLHLCPVTLPDGTIFNPGDVILQGSIPGKTTQTMTALIQNYPCGAGLVCFGATGVDGRGRCASGQCCSTVSWAVPGQDSCPPARQISSKCRHQQICIQGRGATLTCVDDPNDPNDDCTPDCGGTATLQFCVSGGTAPFTFALSDGQTFGPTNDTCHNFKVTVTQTTTFSGTVTDSSNPPCAENSNSVTLQVTPLVPQINVDSSNCNGVLTISTSVPGFSGCSFAYTIDNQPAANIETDTKIVRVNANGTLSYRNLDNTCHTIGVTATCGVCSGNATKTVKQACVVTTTGC